MRKPCVLISGPDISVDRELCQNLGKTATVLVSAENNRIESIVSRQRVDLVLFEMTSDASCEAGMIKEIKSQYPGIDILLVNGNSDIDSLTKAFAGGAKDRFRKPYKKHLIVERVNALLNIRQL